jgi:hypothetical protein
VALSNRLKAKEIEENLSLIREYTSLEASSFNSESIRDVADHDYAARLIFRFFRQGRGWGE